jgi:hypothetical protein
MTINPEEREIRLRNMWKDGKDLLLEHYSALFVQFMDEADALFSRGDHASAADVLMKATLYNKMLTDIDASQSVNNNLL